MPSPVVGHAATLAEVDRGLAGRRIAVAGNWFGGLALEDCVLRARAEWNRLTQTSRSTTMLAARTASTASWV